MITPLCPSGTAEHAFMEYSWDEWSVHEDYADSTTGYEDRLVALSDSGNMALAIAVAEWIVCALRQHDLSQTVEHYIEASWAAFSETYAPSYFELEDDEWRGPYRGMLNMTLTVLNDGIFCRDEDPDVADRTNCILYYACKLFGHWTEFISWVEACLQRLEAYYSRPPGEETYQVLPLRPAVSREFFRINTAPKPEHANVDVEAFLTEVAPSNPFIILSDSEQAD